MATVTLDNVSKFFGAVPAVQQLSCCIAEGEFLALLGPSGCGKTTTLLMLAGIYRPSSGTVRFDDRVMNEVPPQQRNIGMVFQSYALYPHLTVYENLAFPLRVQRQPRAVIHQKVHDIAALVHLHEFLQRKPAQLSGGQQQRVALGRALIKAPDVLLLDEPLSHLDTELRGQMRAEIKRLQRTLGITTILVTHDQIEALSMADRILVLRAGTLQQLAAPQTLYTCPANQFVARFIGSTPMNFFLMAAHLQERLFYLADTACPLPIPDALWSRLAAASGTCPPSNTVRTTACTLQVLLGLRAEDIVLHQQSRPSTLPATVTLCEPLGREVLVSATYGPHLFKVLVPAPCALSPAAPVWLDLSRGPHHVFEPQSGLALPVSAPL